MASVKLLRRSFWFEKDPENFQGLTSTTSATFFIAEAEHASREFAPLGTTRIRYSRVARDWSEKRK